MKKLLLIGTVLVSVFCANAQSYRMLHAMLKNNNTDTTVVTIRDRIIICNKALCNEWLAGTIDSTSLTNGNRITRAKMEEYVQRSFSNGGTSDRIADAIGFSSQFKSAGLSITDFSLRNAWLVNVWLIVSRIGEGSY